LAHSAILQKPGVKPVFPGAFPRPQIGGLRPSSAFLYLQGKCDLRVTTAGRDGLRFNRLHTVTRLHGVSQYQAGLRNPHKAQYNRGCRCGEMADAQDLKILNWLFSAVSCDCLTSDILLGLKGRNLFSAGPTDVPLSANQSGTKSGTNRSRLSVNVCLYLGRSHRSERLKSVV
jgi:hypothetical protein